MGTHQKYNTRMLEKRRLRKVVDYIENARNLLFAMSNDYDERLPEIEAACVVACECLEVVRDSLDKIKLEM